MNKVTWFSFLLAFCLTSNVHATVLTFDSGGLVTGATGIFAGGQSWDVTLLDGTCEALFPECDDDSDFLPIVETDQIDISNVLFALLTEVDDSSLGQSDIFGCGNNFDCRIFSPIGFSELSSNVLTVFGSFTGTNIGGGTQGISPSQDFAASDVLAWAKVTPSAIPAPAVLPLFGTGLAILGLFGWRQRRLAIA